MEEIKVDVNRNEFIKLIADEVYDVNKDRNNLTTILMGGIVTKIFCEKLFGESDTVCFTENEFCELTSEAIVDFTENEKDKPFTMGASLLAVLISGRIKRKLFNEEVKNNGN